MSYVPLVQNPTPLCSPKATVNGSTSGTAIFTETRYPNSTYSVLIYCNALLGTATYTYPYPMTYTPQIVATNGPAASVVTSLSNTSVTVTGATTTGFIQLVGY
jgi:hypothetical protein